MFNTKKYLKSFSISLTLAVCFNLFSCFDKDNEDKTTTTTPYMVVFVKDDGSIYKKNADGTGSEVLVSPDGDFANLAISFDQKKVAFIAYAGVYAAQIYIISIHNDGAALPAPWIDSGTNEVYEPAFSKDGTKISFRHSNYDDDTLSGIYVADVSTGASSKVRIANAPGVATHPSWSPDGSMIVYENGFGTLYTISATDMSDTPHKLCDDEGFYPIWSPAGNTIAFAGVDGLRLVTYTSGSSGTSTSLTDDVTDYPAYWLPDGTRIIFSRQIQTPAVQWDVMSIRISDKSETNITNTSDEDEFI
jgi:Tol biopolymer transport system component